MSEILGIFGGTFDPPHIGHQILAAEAQYQLGLDRVLWVLTPDPPHKKNQMITPLDTRMEFVRASVANLDTFEISSVDIDRNPPHFAVDTVRLLQKQFPQAKLIYLMGGDSLRDLPLWFEARKFVARCHALGVMHRPAVEVDLKYVEGQIPGIQEKIRFFETPLLEISASEIRKRIQSGQPYRFFLPEKVFEIIQSRNLYRQDEKEDS